MARGSGGSNSSGTSADNNSNANELDSLLAPITPLAAPLVDYISALTPLNEIQDLRQFTFDAYEKPLKTFAGITAGIAPAGVRGAAQSLPAFRDPKNALVCVRRKVRREVLHALHLTRRGRGGSRPRRTYRSHIKC